MARLKDPVAAGESLLVRPETMLVRADVADRDGGVEFAEGGGEAPPVLHGWGRHDVEILRRPHVAVRSEREAADHHELDARAVKRREQFARLKPTRFSHQRPRPPRPSGTRSA